MQQKLHRGQRGLSFFGLVIVIVVLACAGVLAAQVFPTLVEYQAILKAAEKAKTGSNPADVRQIFEKASAVDDIKSVQPKDLEVVKNGDGYQVKFAYNKEIHMFGPAFLLIKYAGQSKP
jgi:Tfp pilus assembly protein PilE